MIGGAVREKRPGLRQLGGKRGSIREVRLVGLSAATDGLEPGDQVGWWGRSYEVEATEGLGGSARYLHLKPAERGRIGA